MNIKKAARYSLLAIIIALAFMGCENPAETGSIPVDTPITIAVITITEPVKGVAPLTTAAAGGIGYTCGAVLWSPDDNPFKGGTVYTAVVTLTANAGYTFTGLNTATGNAQTAVIVSNTGKTITLMLTFAPTDTDDLAHTHDWGEWIVTIAPTATKNGVQTRTCKLDSSHTEEQAIPATGIKTDPIVTWPQGLTAVYGQILFNIPLASYTNGGGTPGAFSWTSPLDSAGNLGTQSHNMTFTPTETADYNTLTQNVAITVNKIGITTADLTITGPVKNSVPVTTAATTDTYYTCGAVSWNPNDNPFLGGKVYAATVTLTADSIYTFTGLSSATINGQNAALSNNTGAAVTLSYTFPATDTRTSTSIVIKTQPDKLTYTHGDTLNLTGLAVTLTYDDASAEDVAAAGFPAKNITVNPAHGIHLSHVTHNNQPVTITYGSLPPLTTSNLTVNKAPGVFGAHPAINTTYTPVLTLGSITLPAGYAWVTPATSLSAGNGQSFAATYTDPSGNYEAATGTIIVNVAKAAGAAVSAPTLNTSAHNSITVNSVTASTGQTAEYAINSTNAAPSIGWQTDPTFGGLNAVATYYLFARSASNANYETGAPSAGTAITTKQRAENGIITYWVDDTGELSVGNGGQGNIVTVPNGGSVTFTANSAGYANQIWTFNGNVAGSGASYTFDTAEEDKEVGRNYIIGLTVQKDSKFYFTEIVVKVVE